MNGEQSQFQETNFNKDRYIYNLYIIQYTVYIVIQHSDRRQVQEFSDGVSNISGKY